MRFLFTLVSAMLIASSGATAVVYVVNAEGTGDFPTIQAAIDACGDGDIIKLTDGTFTGDGNRDVDYLGKAITVQSHSGDPGTCIIDCEGTEADPHRGFCFRSNESSAAVLEGLTITGGLPPPPEDGGGGITCTQGASPTITRCILSGNRAGVGGGMHSDHASPTITDCIFSHNSAQYGGGAFGCRGPSSLTLSGCTFSGNSASRGGGVYC